MSNKIGARENVEMFVNDGILTIKIRLDDVATYDTEKSTMYATTGGNQPVPGAKGFKLGLNLYKSKNS